ncbi:thioredoxin-like protein [Xylogone sp. PMI_703]|nr:thioredoxin-like protein [Xylogone sp. PMI_703]
MFRFHKTLDVITLFHKASVPASVRVQTLLKQASANISAHATEDQASNASAQLKPNREEFELNITEDPPTPDQLKNILEYLGPNSASKVVSGAKSEADALKKLKENGDNFVRPVTVDWNNGRAVAGENTSEILKMVQAIPKE